MDNKEKWKFFSNPPQSVKEVYKLLSLLSEKMNAEITTLPWELCEKDICAPAFATNRIEHLSHESMELGEHEDYDTETGISFGIPNLYSKEPGLHPSTFVNGSPGKPWLVSLMLYATSDDFDPKYGLGTVFCNSKGKVMARADTLHMRFVLFEGNIVHGIEESKIPPGIKPWRVSYVLKLVINPRSENQSMKKSFYEIMKSYKNTL